MNIRSEVFLCVYVCVFVAGVLGVVDPHQRGRRRWSRIRGRERNTGGREPDNGGSWLVVLFYVYVIVRVRTPFFTRGAYFGFLPGTTRTHPVDHDNRDDYRFQDFSSP